jgi:hypothetical protein
MKTIYIVPIEPIDARYTKQWYENIPKILEHAIADQKLECHVVTIDGVSIPAGTTTGAFLDFGATNVYKASQTEAISRLFSNGEIKPGDRFLVTDAWNFVVTAIRYMSDLLDIPVEIHGIWHAGAYDPTDILGYKMQKPWPHHQERAWFHACDYNYYATDFHKDMFLRNLEIPAEFHHKAVRSGQPHTPIIDQCSQYWGSNLLKSDTMIWPHRYNADKQPDIVEDLQSHIYGTTLITQKLNLSKTEYYQTLGRCKVLFSCSLHENLGISVMEGVLAGVIPILPDRCSYSEMYLPEFKYPSIWTESWEQYLANRDALAEFINDRIVNYGRYLPALLDQKAILIQEYLQPTVMVNQLLD